MLPGTPDRIAAAMARAGASVSCRRPIDDMEKRSRRGTLPRALFRHLDAGRIFAIDQGIAANRNDAGIVEFMAEHFATGGADRTVALKPGAAIPEMQFAFCKRSFESQQTGHLVPNASSILQPAPQHHVTAALAMDRNRTRGQFVKANAKIPRRRQH